MWTEFSVLLGKYQKGMIAGLDDKSGLGGKPSSKVAVSFSKSDPGGS